MESIQQYIKEQKTLLEQTLREMALIKAPTGHEKKRAEYRIFGRNRIDDKRKKGEVVLSGNWR